MFKEFLNAAVIFTGLIFPQLHQTSSLLDAVASNGWKVDCQEMNITAVELDQAAKLQIFSQLSGPSCRKPRISFLFASAISPTINSTCFVDFHLNSDAF